MPPLVTIHHTALERADVVQREGKHRDGFRQAMDSSVEFGEAGLGVPVTQSGTV